MAAVPEKKPEPILSVLNIEVIYDHVILVLRGVSLSVAEGGIVALLGANGQATGPHLHFEVHVGGMMGTKIDPLPWLRARGVAI